MNYSYLFDLDKRGIASFLACIQLLDRYCSICNLVTDYTSLCCRS